MIHGWSSSILWKALMFGSLTKLEDLTKLSVVLVQSIAAIVNPSAQSVIASLSDRQLLSRVVGVKAAKAANGDSFKAMFSEPEHPLHERCTVARELVRRWLHEEMRERSLLNSPDAVREYLRNLFAGREF